MKGVKDKQTGRFVKNIPTEKVCLSCSESFTPRHEKQIFCGVQCRSKSVTKDKTRLCAICSKSFSSASWKTRFCSQVCYTQSGKRAKRGAENHLWKGGITPFNTMVRQTGKYKKWVISILRRDNYTCVNCEERGNTLHVDHIIPFSAIIEKIRFEFGDENLLEEVMRSELLWDGSNGRTLCVPCHKATDTYLKRNANQYVV